VNSIGCNSEYFVKNLFSNSRNKISDRRPEKIWCSSAFQIFLLEYLTREVIFREDDISSASKNFGEICKSSLPLLQVLGNLSLLRVTIFHATFAEASRLVKGTGIDRPWGLQVVEAFTISRKSAHERNKVFSPTHWF